VGIAQRVLTASARGNSMKMNFGIVTINEIPFFGTATIGLVYGVTFNVFTDLPEIAMKNHEEGKPISHNPFKVTGLKHMYSTRITSG